LSFFPGYRYAFHEQGNCIFTIKLSNGKEIVGHGKSKKKAKQNAYQKAKKQ
jgi:dsRNA-specific ribonuclease